MNKFAVELDKLNKMREKYEENRMQAVTLESDIVNKKASRESRIQQMILAGTPVDYSKLDAETTSKEKELTSLLEHNEHVRKAIELQSTEIVPRAFIDQRTAQLDEMNAELTKMMDAFDKAKFDESVAALKKIYDYIDTIKTECHLYGYVYPGYDPTAELRFLNNFAYFTSLSVEPFWDFIAKHKEVSAQLVSEIEDSIKNYQKAGGTLPRY